MILLFQLHHQGPSSLPPCPATPTFRRATYRYLGVRRQRPCRKTAMTRPALVEPAASPGPVAITATETAGEGDYNWCPWALSVHRVPGIASDQLALWIEAIVNDLDGLDEAAR